MSDIGSENKRQWNGLLSSWTDNGYSAIVNFDIVPVSYNHYWAKHRPTSFYYKKRRAYNPVYPTRLLKKWWEITDVVTINESWCDDGECTEYMMAIHKRSWKMKVFTSNCWEWELRDLCWNSWLDEELWDLDECWDCFCECQYDKFILTDFVKWTPRHFDSNGTSTRNTWVQANIANGTVGVFYDEWAWTSNDYNAVQIGDWVYVHWTPWWGWDAYCGQARQVVDKKGPDSLIDKPYLLLNAPWLYLWAKSTQEQIDEDDKISQYQSKLRVAIDEENVSDIEKYQSILNSLMSLKEDGLLTQVIQTWENAVYSIYPERWEVVMYATCSGLKTIHDINWQRDPTTHNVLENYVADVTISCSSFKWDICTYWVDVFNNRLNILGNQWFNLSWETWENKMSFRTLNYVWEDKTAQTVFRNFLVQFGRENMSVVVYNEAWDSFSYKLDSSMGIFSRTSFISYQNSLYFIGSDKRLYSADIGSNGNGWYILNVTDQSAQIRGDLELLQEWDEVNMDADGTHMYIFINNKHDPRNSNNTKTRILKYFKDYNRWVYHDFCCGIIKHKRKNYFLWDTIYQQGQYDFRWSGPSKDCGNNFVESYIEFYVWENEDWQTQFNTISFKELEWLKILLGRGIYTDWSTKVVIDSQVHWYKQQYQVSTFEHIPRVDAHNKIRQWITPNKPSDCALDVLAECSNVIRPCKWMKPTDTIIWLDNCVCYDDKAYELADTYNVFINLKHLKRSDLYRIRIMSLWWDEMVFGWAVAWVEIYPIETHDSDDEDLINNWDECCAEGKFIDSLDPCNCSI